VDFVLRSDFTLPMVATEQDVTAGEIHVGNTGEAKRRGLRRVSGMKGGYLGVERFAGAWHI
jgi:hypothetical protein